MSCFVERVAHIRLFIRPTHKQANYTGLQYRKKYPRRRRSCIDPAQIVSSAVREGLYMPTRLVSRRVDHSKFSFFLILVRYSEHMLS